MIVFSGRGRVKADWKFHPFPANAQAEIDNGFNKAKLLVELTKKGRVLSIRDDKFVDKCLCVISS